MQCSDLERYLEAFLDGRLGRTRTSVLKRHLGACMGCRMRLEKLRHFERDLNRRLRTVARKESMWASLEPDLVRSTQVALPAASLQLRLLPPSLPALAATAPEPVTAAAREPAPQQRRARRIAPKIVGVLLIMAAAGAVVEAARVFLLSPDHDGAEFQVYLDHVANLGPLPIETGDPRQLQSWLKTTTGISYPPPPMPAGFTLVGGKVERVAGALDAVLVYTKHGTTALLYIEQAAAPGNATVCVGDVKGVSNMRWSRDGFDFSVLSSLPAQELLTFEPTSEPHACAVS